MHLLLVTYEFPPFMATGGIGSYMYHLAHVMAAKGHHVTVFSATQSHAEVTVRKETAYTNYLIPAADTVVFRKEVLKLFESYIQNHRVDVIESPEVGACALHIKEAYPFLPLVVKMHTPGVLITKVSNTYQSVFTKLRYVAGAFLRGRFDLGYWSKTDLNKESNPEYRICQLADQLLSPSAALKDWAVRYWQLPEQKIKILPNPITADEHLFSFPLSNRSKTICFIGKLTVLKGMMAFTPAIKEILLGHSDYKIIIAGRDEALSDAVPSMKAWMLDQLEAVKDRVVFTGAVEKENVLEILSQSKVCIVPSLWENYPNVVLEAMAAGCTVAAAHRGGIPELIDDGNTGLLFDPLKPSSIVKAIDQLLNDEPKRLQLAAAARETVYNHQHSTKLANDLDAFYRSVQKPEPVISELL
ncbi:MAG: glycosyltransferase family 4 protein [Lacibacter sp.]